MKCLHKIVQKQRKTNPFAKNPLSTHHFKMRRYHFPLSYLKDRSGLPHFYSYFDVDSPSIGLENVIQFMQALYTPPTYYRQFAAGNARRSFAAITAI